MVDSVNADIIIYQTGDGLSKYMLESKMKQYGYHNSK